MKHTSYFRALPGLVGLTLALALVLAPAARAQQIIREQLLLRAGADLGPVSVAAAPNGEFVLVGPAYRVPGGGGAAFSHLCVARLNALGDTLWCRFLFQGPTESNREAVEADAGGIWLLNPDTLQSQTNPNGASVGTRLWRLSAAGRLRRVVRPAYRLPGEYAQYLLPGIDGDVYALLYNELPRFGTAPSLLRFDSTGVLRWRHNYSYAANNYGASLCYTPRGTVLLAGQTGADPSLIPRVRLLESETGRGDSIGGAVLPLAPGVSAGFMNSRNDAPYEAIALRGGGYAVPSEATPSQPQLVDTGELTRLDAGYNVVWRYLIPAAGAAAGARHFTQVRELADGTLLALARAPYAPSGRTFWLYRFDGATGALLAVHPFTSAFAGQRRVVAAHLLPVAADSTLLVVGQSVAAAAPFDQGVYVARVRIPNLPRVVTGTMPGRVVAAALGMPYPNPADRNLQVAYALPEASGAAYLELRDVLGQVVHRQLLTAVSGKAQLPVGQLGQGLYTCVLVVNGKVQAARRVAVVR